MNGTETNTQGAPPPSTRRQGISPWALLGAALFGGLVAGVLVLAVTAFLMGIGWGDQESYITYAAAKATPSVVCINVETTLVDTESGESTAQPYALGSGVIISEDGYILTNNHVVSGDSLYEPVDAVQVVLGGSLVPARIVGRDPMSDLAVIKVEATGLSPIEFGSSAELKLGDRVVAVGNPQGLGISVSAGIVSAKNRTQLIESEEEFVSYVGAIQTDAEINGGNSGGALCDAAGRLVGINSMSFVGMSGNAQALNFAIPSDYARRIAEELIATGRATHPYMGLVPVALTRDVLTGFELPMESGVVVDYLMEGSPADDAGIQAGNVITMIDDVPMISAEAFYGTVQSHEIGDVVTVTFWNDTGEQQTEVTLGSDADFR